MNWLRNLLSSFLSSHLIAQIFPMIIKDCIDDQGRISVEWFSKYHQHHHHLRKKERMKYSSTNGESSVLIVYRVDLDWGHGNTTHTHNLHRWFRFWWLPFFTCTSFYVSDVDVFELSLSKSFLENGRISSGTSSTLISDLVQIYHSKMCVQRNGEMVNLQKKHRWEWEERENVSHREKRERREKNQPFLFLRERL